jgi:hypothetical protein
LGSTPTTDQFVKVNWKEICKFLAGASFVNAGILFYLYLTKLAFSNVRQWHQADMLNALANVGFWGQSGQ